MPPNRGERRGLGARDAKTRRRLTHNSQPRFDDLRPNLYIDITDLSREIMQNRIAGRVLHLASLYHQNNSAAQTAWADSDDIAKCSPSRCFPSPSASLSLQHSCGIACLFNTKTNQRDLSWPREASRTKRSHRSYRRLPTKRSSFAVNTSRVL